MNLVTIMVGFSIMGVATPMILDMSLAPVIAQKRAQNFGAAESAAVTYSAAHEGKEVNLPEPPSGCELISLTNDGLAWKIKCLKGDGQMKAEASRSFRVLPLINEGIDGGTGANGTGSAREFARETPAKDEFYHAYCYQDDPWGLDWFDRHPNLDQPCKPRATETEQAYLDSDPDAWLFDINQWDGWSSHPKY